MSCGHAQLTYPPVGAPRPRTEPPPEKRAARDERMARIARRKALKAPPENKAVFEPPEDK